ncbi:MAG: YggS family pyridoxal phosphate-dependent enzyme [Nitrospirota bacterium]
MTKVRMGDGGCQGELSHLPLTSITQRVQWIRERIEAARRRRSSAAAGPVALLAATKGIPVEMIQEAVEAGVDAIGENRAQELAHKCSQWRPPVPCHFIGRLQRNKVRLALQWCDVIQSVDSLPLAEAIHRQAAGRRRRVLVQVNVAAEATKAGFAPDAVAPALEQMAQWDGLAVEGLMAIPPYAADPESARPYFRQLRALAERMGTITGISMTTLSMGMSHDFEVAVEEGATMVRIGTALFGPRKD